MNRRLRPWFCFCLLAASTACERQEQGKRPDDAAGSGPEISRTKRMPRESMPEKPKREAVRQAFAKAEGIANPAARAKAMAEVAWNALEVDPEFARQVLERLAPDSPERIPLLQHLAMRMADEDPDAALAWAATLGSEYEIAAARARIALVIADSDPPRAANLLSEFGIAGREFDVAVVQVLQHWAGQSPADAAAWVALFPAGGFRKAGIETVVAKWTASAPKEVLAWLPTIQDESARAEATQAVGEFMRRQSPETREDWLQAADPGIRAALERAAEKPAE